MVEVSLPNPNFIGGIAILILAGIVIWDAFWLTRQRTDVPKIGELSAGFAWTSEGSNEVIRQWGNLFSMAVMMALPWGFVEISGTSYIWALIWDVLLSLHLISLLIPKRYAVSRTHLFADGQRYSWERLNLAKKQPKRRIMLLRKGWGVFGPLPVGVKQEERETALEWIKAAIEQGAKWDEKVDISKQEE